MFNFYFNFYNNYYIMFNFYNTFHFYAGIIKFRLNIMEIILESGLICLDLLPMYDITVHSK